MCKEPVSIIRSCIKVAALTHEKGRPALPAVLGTLRPERAMLGGKCQIPTLWADCSCNEDLVSRRNQERNERLACNRLITEGHETLH
jgi:hypothetical protein